MCFVWISGQIKIILLWESWLVFVIETDCVHCAVRSESLTLVQINFHPEIVRAMHRQSRACHRGGPVSITDKSMRDIWWTEATETGFSASNSVAPCQYHSTSAVYSYSCTYFSYQKDRWAKPGNLPNNVAVSEIGYHWIEKGFHFWSLLKGEGLNVSVQSIDRHLSFLFFAATIAVVCLFHKYICGD